MINWIRRKLYNFINATGEAEAKISRTLVTADSSDHLEDNTLRFTVTPARGGVIVSVRQYDRRKDEQHNTLHVIHDDEEVAHRVSEIVSMELLRSR